MYRIPNRIFVGGIPQTASQDELKEYFSHFGQVKDARIITDPRGNSRGYGFVTYENENDASKVLSLREEELIFKENKLNIGHAFRKKNFVSNYNNNNGMQGGSGHHNGHGMNHMNQHGMNNGMGNMSSMGQNGHHHHHHASNNHYMDGPMNNMHHMGGINGLGNANMHHHGHLGGHLSGHLGGLGGLGGMGMNTMNGMNGMNTLNGLNGMNMN